MPPGEHGCTEQGHPPVTVRRGRDEDAPPHSPPPFPFPEAALEMNKRQQPAPELPEQALVEILSRVPYKSLCRFKCVSKPCLALCSDLDVRRRCPQTLAGFFYNRSACGLSFRNLSGGEGPPLVDPALPFLQGRYERVELQQCCGGLLLCRYWESYKGRKNKKNFGYAVCNPATGEWTVLTLIVLPDPDDGVPVIYDVNDLFLGFDPAVPSRFVVFAPLSNVFGEFAQVAIFSSETRRWTSVESEWPYKTVLLGGTECAFLNGTMHLTTHRGTVVTVDAEGKTWREIEDGMEHCRVVSIGHSQGSLHAWLVDNDKDPELSVWVLENYATGKWILKHTVEISELFGRQRDKDEACYSMLAIHPDCNLVFLTDSKKMTVSYDMDTRKVDVICTSGEFLVGAPYVPCFVEMSAGGH